MKECSTPTCSLPVFASRRIEPSNEDSISVYYCIAHAMEYAEIMKSQENK